MAGTPATPDTVPVPPLGSGGKIEATEDQLAAVARAVDDPAEELRPLAAYLAQAYGPTEARTMTATWAEAMRTIIGDGGDISRSLAHSIACPALLISGTLGYLLNRSCSAQRVALGGSDLAELNQRPGPMTFNLPELLHLRTAGSGTYDQVCPQHRIRPGDG